MAENDNVSILTLYRAKDRKTAAQCDRRIVYTGCEKKNDQIIF